MLGTVEELALKIGGTVVGDGTVDIETVAAIGDSTETTLTFATNKKYFEAALAGKAAAVLAEGTFVEPGRAYAKPLIVVESARVALVLLLEDWRTPRPKGPFRHPSAVVESDAEVADDAYIGAHAYVGAKAKIGAGATIDVGAYVGAETIIGMNTWLHPQARVMERCKIGNSVVLHSGCVIGSEGFGWAFVGDQLKRIPQVGNVELDNDVEIGANTCVDRAQTGSTRIGSGTKVDNLCQIGHNCHIGKYSVFAALTGLAGTTVIGDQVQVGGQSGFAGHITIGSKVTVAGGAQVWSDVGDGLTVSGVPARSHIEHLRQEAMIRKLPDLLRRIDDLERSILGDKF
jgi:UDP-3-O-[3-hydroxymyristoyl] glucosamine N-acyltransferase